MDFNLTYIFESLKFLKPEITVSLFLVILVTVDLILGKKNKQVLPYIALAGLLITGYFVIQQFGTSAFASVQNNIGNFGLIAVDSFGNYFKLIILLSSIFVVLFSISSIEIKAGFRSPRRILFANLRNDSRYDADGKFCRFNSNLSFHRACIFVFLCFGGLYKTIA